jgi:hypothetical protein
MSNPIKHCYRKKDVIFALLQGLERQLETPKSIKINKKVEGQ